jgi:hypothetical protein
MAWQMQAGRRRHPIVVRGKWTKKGLVVCEVAKQTRKVAREWCGRSQLGDCFVSGLFVPHGAFVS